MSRVCEKEKVKILDSDEINAIEGLEFKIEEINAIGKMEISILTD